MNQILYVEKPKNSGKGGFKLLAKISAIIMIIFAVILIVVGILKIVNSASASGKNEPKISIREVEDDLELSVTHDKAIDKIIYSWNGENEVELQGKNRTEVIEKIELPTGNNVLSVKVIDIDKNETEYTKSYYKEADEDNVKPQIEFSSSESSKAKITVKDNKELAYVMYHWNNEEDTTLQPNEDSKKIIEEKIPLLKGKNTLTVTAVDAAGNEQIATKEYLYAKKPTINITQEGQEVLIKVFDEENIQKIELTLNGQFFSTDSEGTGVALNMQEAEIRQPLQAGQNTITVKVYNVNGLDQEETKTFDLSQTTDQQTTEQ